MKVNGRILVTTMLDARQVSKGELSDLYACRWHVELDLRNIKTTLGMDVLRCLTPQVIEKELWVSLPYNVIRLLMAQAAREAGVHPRELSFKHNRADVDAVGLANSAGRSEPDRVLPADRAVHCRQQARTDRAVGSQEAIETLPLAESASG